MSRTAADGAKAKGAVIDFGFMGNPLGPPETLRRIISRSVELLCRYPDQSDGALAQVIAGEPGVAAKRVVTGCGATELLSLIPRVLDRPRAIIPLPAPAMYAAACRRAGMETVCPVLGDESDFRPRLGRLASLLRGDEIVFLGQPNDPIGRTIPRDELLRLVNECAETFFVLDESLADFVADYHSLAGVDAANLLVVRSLSKFFAVPGLRIGFCCADTTICSRLREQIVSCVGNPMAAEVGRAFLADAKYIAESRETVARLRQGLTEKLSRLPGLTVFPGEANFLLIRIDGGKMTASTLREKLRAESIEINDSGVDFSGLPENGSFFFRVAVRREEDNEQLVAALEKLLHGAPRKTPSRRTPSLMLQGTASNAGKSVLTAALCRILLQDGLRVAPFKAQNMSLNSYVTRDGLEMGRAQVVQAQAARLDPDVRMNPVLLKPSSEVGSQVIVNGRPVANMTINQYVAYKPRAWQAACAAYDSLAQEYDAVILEGAGSPGEVNLKHHDIVNMRMARYAGAPVLLVGDIDRGGVFASFVGIMEVLAEWERELVAGFVVNRFRGTESLLQDAFDYTLAHTGRPVLGVVPYLPGLGLPEEDSVGFKAGLYERSAPSGDHVEIALIDLPHISNFTDFEPFLAEPDVHLRIIRKPADLEAVRGQVAALLLPGSKNVMTDLDYLVESGLADLIRRMAGEGGVEIAGICGGFQMLGSHINDPHGLESAGKTIPGLGLLPLATTLEPDKTLTRRSAVHEESGLAVHGYEIHHGRTSSNLRQILAGVEGERICAASANGMVWGSYLHGIFDADPFRRWFIDRLRERRGLAPQGRVLAAYDLEPAFDRLADIVRRGIDMKAIYRLLGL
ncbi:MAG: cobyric acid synthase CobQ [Desulfobulbaceae bacterium DB1]|nr:MAG: cobyric acid synthase CobQ [Desulfobulbaceae bacterium DB1]